MLYTWLSVIIRMPAAFQNIIKSKDIALDISIRVRDRITHAGLCRQIDDGIEFFSSEQVLQGLSVFEVHLDEPVSGITIALHRLSFRNEIPVNACRFEPGVFEPDIVIVIDRIYADDLIARFEQSFG